MTRDEHYELSAYIWGFCVGAIGGAFLMFMTLALTEHLS